MNRKQMVKVGISILASLILMTTNFAGIVAPQIVKAATNVSTIYDIANQVFQSTTYRAKAGDYILQNDLHYREETVGDPNFPECHLTSDVDATIDLNGNDFTITSYSVLFGTLTINNSNSNSGGALNKLSISGGTCYLNGGTIYALSVSSGTVNQSEGRIESLTIWGGTVNQTGGWNNRNKTITFDYGNGSSVQVTTLTTNNVEKIPATSIPARPTSSDFLGWFDAPTGGSEVIVNANTEFTNNATLYAHWRGTSVPVTPITTPIPLQETTDETIDDTPDVDYLDALYKAIRRAIDIGGPQTVYWNEGTALPSTVMKLLKENPQITLIFNYTYMNKDYSVALPGSKVEVDPEIPWYGPLYLYGKYGSLKANGVPTQTTSGR